MPRSPCCPGDCSTQTEVPTFCFQGRQYPCSCQTWPTLIRTPFGEINATARVCVEECHPVRSLASWTKSSCCLYARLMGSKTAQVVNYRYMRSLVDLATVWYLAVSP